ncbi:hypothetical protein HNP25_004368 [Arcicella rosea]|uniref:Uncharacterized protein n=1 Tax=Arcicella rosea TaxID=502909 RepID=A0A841EW88_9BACT|nr:hypothetical protein [Arcicella rosea]
MNNILISKSWKSLSPKYNIDSYDEGLEEYFLRNKKK